MNQCDSPRLRRAFVVYLTACFIGGLSAAILLYVLLPIEGVFAIAAVFFVSAVIVWVFAIRRIRALARSD